MASVGQETPRPWRELPPVGLLADADRRILKINDFNYVTRFVVETARETLVIGSTQPHLSWNNSPKIIGKVSHTQTQLELVYSSIGEFGEAKRDSCLDLDQCTGASAFTQLL